MLGSFVLYSMFEVRSDCTFFVDICGIVAQNCLNFHLVISFIFSIYLLRIWICIWIMETRRILILKCHFQEAKFDDFGLHVWCNFTICILFTYTLINVLLCFMKVLSPNHFKRIPSSRPNISNPNSSKAPCTWKVENIIKLYRVFNKIVLNRLNWNLKRLHDKMGGR